MWENLKNYIGLNNDSPLRGPALNWVEKLEAQQLLGKLADVLSSFDAQAD